MTTIQQLNESRKHMALWIKIYNILCRKCKVNLVRSGSGIKDKGTEEVISSVDNQVKNKFCPICNKNIDKIMENYQK